MKKILMLSLVGFLLNFTFVSANYIQNIDDNFKIYSAMDKVNHMIDSKENPEKVRKNLQERVKNIIKEQLGTFDEKYTTKLYDKTFTSKKEYVFYRVLEELSMNRPKNQGSDYKLQIVENDYVRVLIYSKNKKLDSEKLYSTNGNRTFLEFFPVDSNTKTKEFIEKNIWKNNKNSHIEKKEGEKLAYAIIDNGKDLSDVRVSHTSALSKYISYSMPKLFERQTENLIVFYNTYTGDPGMSIQLHDIEFKK